MQTLLYKLKFQSIIKLINRMKKYTLLLIFIGINAVSAKIKLTDVDAVTFRYGEMTTGRRNSPISQLKCTGVCHNSPKTIQCKNIGSDGVDVQWDCSAELPENLKFGIVNVNCEGYDYPLDPYILEGSCQIQYELQSRNIRNYSKNNFPIFAIMVLIGTIFACNNSGNGGGNYVRPGGFWSGVGVGALAGNAFAGRRHYGYGGARRRWSGVSSCARRSTRRVRVGARTTRR